MIYIIRVYKYSDAKKILKGFDKGMPVFVSQGEYNKGNTAVQEYANTSTAMRDIEKIKKAQPWRHYEIVKLV